MYRTRQTDGWMTATLVVVGGRGAQLQDHARTYSRDCTRHTNADCNFLQPAVEKNKWQNENEEAEGQRQTQESMDGMGQLGAGGR